MNVYVSSKMVCTACGLVRLYFSLWPRANRKSDINEVEDEYVEGGIYFHPCVKGVGEAGWLRTIKSICPKPGAVAIGFEEIQTEGDGLC